MIREKSSAQRGTVATACLDKAIADCAAELWAETDTLRGSIDAAEYRIVVLGLIFLKYISDAFEERRVDVLAEFDEDSIADRVAYGPAHNIRVPSEARWAHLRVRANQPAVGQIVDRAMAAVERDNPELVDVLPKNYARLALDDQWLQRLIELIGNCSPSDGDFRAQDVAGRVYDCFLSQLARAEDKKGGRVSDRIVCRQSVGWDAAAGQGQDLRPMLRLGCLAGSVGRLRSGLLRHQWEQRQIQGRCQHSWTGVAPLDMAACKDESGNPRHRRPNCPRRQPPR